MLELGFIGFEGFLGILDECMKFSVELQPKIGSMVFDRVVIIFKGWSEK